MIQIKCKTGYSLPLSKFRTYPGKLKKHSMLEIERVVDSIINKGILFPITIGKVDNLPYIIDGETTYYALCELEDRGFELPEIPIVEIEVDDNIKELILIGTSINHCVTETSLKEFVKDTDINLKEYAFNNGELIDFFTVYDIERFFEKTKNIIPNTSSYDTYYQNMKDGLL